MSYSHLVGWLRDTDASHALKVEDTAPDFLLPAASEETQDEGSVAAQLLGGVETAVGVWQEEIWQVSPTFNACDALVSRSQPTRWLYDTQFAALNVVNSSVRIWASVLSVWLGIGKAEGCGSIGWKRLATGMRVVVMRARSPPPGALRAACPGWGTSTDQSRSRATLTKASSAGE